MLRLSRTAEHIALLYLKLKTPCVLVIENFIEDCGSCLSKAVFPGKSFVYGTVEQEVIDRRVRVFLIENSNQWKVARQIIESFHAKTILYAQTSDWEGVQSYIIKYNPLFQELIELSPAKKVYGIKLEDLKRHFNCKVAWENKDWICIEESEGEIPGAKLV